VSAYDHWEGIWRTKTPRAVSWYEQVPDLSLRKVEGAIANGARSLIDVGGGASSLIDNLIGRHLRLAVLDISPTALDVTRERLGAHAEEVEWITGDVVGVDDLGRFDVWHDRAVFHFLTNPADRDRYVQLCERTVTPGGIAIVATFAPDGPEMCSGLPVCRYDAARLASECGPKFELLDSERYVHTTPGGVRQPFLYASFRRSADDRKPVSV
jgi:SAM-dependent methyltransferase